VVQRRDVAFLRRVLYLDALTLAVAGLALVATPRFTLEDVLSQPSVPDDAFLRVLGVCMVTLAMVMVLVGHRVAELWWWCWAFVALEGGTASVATLHAAFGLPGGTAAWPWWALAVGSWAFAGAFLWGLARAGVEAPLS
jgi:hypothetical protein